MKRIDLDDRYVAFPHPWGGLASTLIVVMVIIVMTLGVVAGRIW